MPQGLRRGFLGVLKGLQRGSLGVEEVLELPVGHDLGGIGDVMPVLGHLQQGGEEGRLVDLELPRRGP